MNGRYLLDTSVIIDLFAGDPNATAGLENADQVLIPSIAVGELFYGAFKSSLPKEELARIEEFVGNSAVLACDAGTARGYGEVKDRLRRRGQPIPENDIWIAAMAVQHGLTLATRDGHFREVEGLTIQTW